MRVLFVTPCYKPYLGGVERVAEEFCRRLSIFPGVEEVGLLTSFYRYPSEIMKGLPKIDHMDGATIFRLPFIPRRAPGFYHLDMGLWAPGMADMIRQFRPTHVHYLLCDWFLPNLQAYWLTRRRAAQILTIFDHEFHPGPRTWPFQWVNGWLSRHVDAVHVVSQRAVGMVSANFGTPPERSVIIPLGANPVAGVPDRRKHSHLTILCVGRICHRKGQLELLECFRRIANKMPASCRLVFVGGDGGDGEALQRGIDSGGLRDKVTVRGYISQEELERCYAESDVFVLLTQDESFGLVFTEAMAAGLPVVTYAVGGATELLTQGAVLLPLGDTAAVEETVLDLFRDPVRRERLSTEAYDFAVRHFSWDSVVEELVKVYEQARSNRGLSRKSAS